MPFLGLGGLVKFSHEPRRGSSLRRSTISIISLSLRDEKEPMVFCGEEMMVGPGYYAVLEGEQLDEWQLYVEGQERSYGMFAGL
jgi:hypothetical protein